MDIKDNLAANLAKYRKAINMTQAELAEKLNYSDKAVSKWERGESVPDLAVLKQLADFYNTTIDELIAEPKEEAKPLRLKNIPKKRFLICSLSTGLVWLVATLCFAFIGVIFPVFDNTWLVFIYAMPITFIIVLVFMSIWRKSLANAIATSLLVWTVILSVHLTLAYTLVNPSPNLWMIYLIGVPLQVLIILWFSYRKTK